ncbi:hypothetical protein HYPSUDRAFT_86236 [Hypholoma sublateritium FD-334 SS-4]|uniref:Uncharacterized protein n=1 Tax=Hypholoma sublateritium (strain FD-334 SS-4) TaxID=945553 RepID=A0A0D2P6L1_HYPSF|nr:hypothetical protein HYPSUDRAFT_86236 [Hypholoma sublateritium FD-334 SS-4]
MHLGADLNMSFISPSSGHLGVAWEVAVVSAFIAVIIAVISVVVFQVRRRKRTEHALQKEQTTRPRRRKPTSKTNLPEEAVATERDLEKGENVDQTEGLEDIKTDEETEDDSVSDPRPKKKRSARSSRLGTKLKSNTKHTRRKGDTKTPARSTNGDLSSSPSDYYY